MDFDVDDWVQDEIEYRDSLLHRRIYREVITAERHVGAELKRGDLQSIVVLKFSRHDPRPIDVAELLEAIHQTDSRARLVRILRGDWLLELAITVAGGLIVAAVVETLKRRRQRPETSEIDELLEWEEYYRNGHIKRRVRYHRRQRR